MKNLAHYFSTLFLLFGCSSIPTAPRIVSSSEIPVCSAICDSNQVCMNTFSATGMVCINKPSPPPFTDLVLPFDGKTDVICTHSSGSGSHSGPNAFFALDLANPYEQPAAVVRAAADGVAYVFLDEQNHLCPEPPGKASMAQSSDCGQSWGNRVKLLHSAGYFSFYTHLDHPLVKTGDFVHKGDPIGIEGRTGAAGHRHLHWSLQKLRGGSQAEWEKYVLSETGVSVPFSFSAAQDGVIKSYQVEKIICSHAGIGAAPTAQQPRFSGVK